MTQTLNRTSSDIQLNVMEKRESYAPSPAEDEEVMVPYDSYSIDYPMQSEEERALVRKLDLYIMPLVCILDFLQFLDKSTINYAALFGFKQDLKLQGNQYSLLGSIFYLGFLAYQLPNNYLLQRIPVGRYIGVVAMIWGAILACTAAGRNFSQVAAMRFLLGLFEGAIYPALTLLISTCYRRTEQAARLGAFWIWNGFALIIGGLISYGIGTMEHTLGLAKWQWIMIILGAVTVFIGLICFFFLIDNPKSKRLQLNAEQEILVEERTRDNAVFRTNTIKKHQIMEALWEPRFWCFCFASLFINMQNGVMSTYSAQMVESFGFNQLQSVLLSVGSGGSDILFIVLSVLAVQRTNQTLLVGCGLMAIEIIGMILLLVIPVTRVKLVGFYLCWTYPAAYVLLITSTANNVSGYTKKIFYNGIQMIFYTIGNFIGPLIMVDGENPPYLGGMLGCIVGNFLVIVLFLIARWQMARVNRYRLAHSSGIITNVEDDLSDVQDPNFIYRL